MEKENKPTEQDLLKAVSEVLDEALATYEQLTKADGIDGAVAVDDMKSQGKGIVGEPTGPAMAKEEDKKDEDKKDKDDKAEKSDSELMDTYKSLVAQMETRGLLQKKEDKAAKKEMKKSETEEETQPAPKSEEVESLRKSIDDRFESLAKTIKDVADAVKKIAATPARKGVAGYQPLRKTEDAPAPLKKGEVLGKLLELRKNGDSRVDTFLINRVETGRLMKGDEERIKSLGILGE